jgi:PAP2 superfamily
MLALVIWTATLLVLPGLVMVAASVAESSWTDPTLVSDRRNRLVAGAACVVVLLLLSLAYQSDSVASPDGKAVAHVAAAPGSGIAKLMGYVTLLGDSVPSLLIAAVLALALYRRGVPSYLCALLPILVLLELYAQLAMWKVFDDATIGSLHAGVPIGGVGQIPSGSVARLLSVFLVAAMLLHARDARWAARLVTLGAVLTTIQITSRLVLGRHLYADLVAGIALGLLLTLLTSFLVLPLQRRTPEPAAPSASRA